MNDCQFVDIIYQTEISNVKSWPLFAPSNASLLQPSVCVVSDFSSHPIHHISCRVQNIWELGNLLLQCIQDKRKNDWMCRPMFPWRFHERWTEIVLSPFVFALCWSPFTWKQSTNIKHCCQSNVPRYAQHVFIIKVTNILRYVYSGRYSRIIAGVYEAGNFNRAICMWRHIWLIGPL